MTNFVPTNLLDGVWIGYNDIANEGIFVWDRTGKAGTYTNWASGQPDNAGQLEDCVEFLTNRWLNLKGAWNDIPCYWNAPFVCKKEGKCASIACVGVELLLTDRSGSVV